MSEEEYAATLDCDKEEPHYVQLSRLTYIYVPDHCEFRANWLRILGNQATGISNIHTNETFMYRDIWKNLQEEEITFAEATKGLKNPNITFSSHPLINSLPSPLRAARFERKNSELGADLSGFMGETRAEVGTLFGLVLLLLGALGALLAFCLRKRSLRSQSVEMTETEDSAANRLRELRDAVRSYQEDMTEELRRLKLSASNLVTTMETSQARGERERESLSRAVEASKQRQESLESDNRRLGSRITDLEEANEKLRAELTKIEKIRMGLEGPPSEKKD